MVAEILMLQVFVCSQKRCQHREMIQELICYKKNVVFVLPYVSIVQEKVRALAPFALELGFHIQVLSDRLIG